MAPFQTAQPARKQAHRHSFGTARLPSSPAEVTNRIAFGKAHSQCDFVDDISLCRATFGSCRKQTARIVMRDKRSRFVELAQARVTKAAQTIRLIGNLSNPNNYAYSEEDAQKILAALDGEMKLLKAKFQTALSKKAKDEFKLD
jgi:hypothetical protein